MRYGGLILRLSSGCRFLRLALVIASCAVATPVVLAAPANCPEPRFTDKAPPEYLERINPLAPGNADRRAASSLFLGQTQRSVNCAICHGKDGDGRGPLSGQFDPSPRNFACAKTIDGVPDGQLFWIIRFGSPGTAMPPHASLTDDQIWQLVLHLRRLAN